jgi:cysteinyl-tRNA synthetase
MVKVDGEKMSKSLGNFTTIRDLLGRGVDPMAVRLFVLMAQYRTPIDFTDEAIAAATNGWHTIKDGLLAGWELGNGQWWFDYAHQPGVGTGKDLEPNLYVERFTEAVNDDFNFPGGLTVLFELAKKLHRERNILVHEGKTETPIEELKIQWQTLVTLAEVLGLTAQPEAPKNEQYGLSDADIDDLIQQRQAARKAKNFAEGDRIRNELQAQGITLIDSPQGTRWHRG